jgi:hypothetical protein
MKRKLIGRKPMVALLRHILRDTYFKLFLLADRCGVHVLPKRYYTPIPDYAWLRRNRRLWVRRANLAGVAWDLGDQVRWLEDTCNPFYSEVSGLSLYREWAAAGYGPGYGGIESQVLHCFCRRYRPKHVIEVGSGVSSACMVAACEKNQNNAEILCIEPYPGAALGQLKSVSVVQHMVQEVDPSVFQRLEAGDLLFIDSSHAVKTGSDVLYLYLEIIPSLKPGIFIHIHDIYLPYLYAPDVLKTYFSWQETALLLALLKGNKQLRVRCCLSALHHDQRLALKNILRDYRPHPENPEALFDISAGHFPSSIWLQTAR